MGANQCEKIKNYTARAATRTIYRTLKAPKEKKKKISDEGKKEYRTAITIRGEKGEARPRRSSGFNNSSHARGLHKMYCTGLLLLPLTGLLREGKERKKAVRIDHVSRKKSTKFTACKRGPARPHSTSRRDGRRRKKEKNVRNSTLRDGMSTILMTEPRDLPPPAASPRKKEGGGGGNFAPSSLPRMASATRSYARGKRKLMLGPRARPDAQLQAGYERREGESSGSRIERQAVNGR